MAVRSTTSIYGLAHLQYLEALRWMVLWDNRCLKYLGHWPTTWMKVCPIILQKSVAEAEIVEMWPLCVWKNSGPRKLPHLVEALIPKNLFLCLPHYCATFGCYATTSLWIKFSVRDFSSLVALSCAGSFQKIITPCNEQYVPIYHCQVS